MEQQIAYYLFIFLVLVMICVITYYVYQQIYGKWAVKKISETSEAYRTVLLLNEKYKFEELQHEYEYTDWVDSKAKFDKYDFSKFLELVMVNEFEDIYEELIFRAADNATKYKNYIDEFSQIKYSTSESVSYQKIERKMCEIRKANPVIEPRIKCCVRYVSPAGRNSYYDYVVYGEKEIDEQVDIYLDRLKKQESAQYQRTLMSPKLRYEILRRDNFKCVICGRSADDGITLHVDHIMPVSKGGKTVESNLRTLCADCNLGKSDSYYENELN